MLMWGNAFAARLQSLCSRADEELGFKDYLATGAKQKLRGLQQEDGDLNAWSMEVSGGHGEREIGRRRMPPVHAWAAGAVSGASQQPSSFLA